MLLGRDPVCQEIDKVIASVGSDVGASLVLIGERGIGKTALLRYAEQRAGSVRALTACGVSAESSLPFAGLHGLLRPILGLLPHIPVRQASALSAGFALMPEAAVDEFAIAAGTLNMLAAARAEGPLLLLVDDFDLWDDTSRAALLFVARRTAFEGVGIILASTTDEEDTGLPCHQIPPLDPSVGGELLRRANPEPIAAAVADQLVCFSAGTPLVLLEMPGVLSPGQLAGAEPLPDPLPVGPRVRHAGSRR